MGRLPKLDDLMAKRIVDAIRKGLSRTAAAAKGGISRRTLQAYLARGRAGDELYVHFLRRVQEAETDVEEEMVECIRVAARDPKYWQAARWWLEACRPADYVSKAGSRDEEADDEEPVVDTDEHILESLLAATRSRKQVA